LAKIFNRKLRALNSSVQCFGAAGWVTGRASDLQETNSNNFILSSLGRTGQIWSNLGKNWPLKL